MYISGRYYVHCFQQQIWLKLRNSIYRVNLIEYIQVLLTDFNLYWHKKAGFLIY